MGYRGLGELISFPTTVVQNHEVVGRPITVMDNAEKLWAKNNLPSKYHATKFDKGPYDRTNTWREHVDWRMACEMDQTTEYVKSLPTLIYISPSEGKSVFYNKGGLKMAGVEGVFNFRDTGRLEHKVHNLGKRATDSMTSPEGIRFRDKHSDSLSKAPDIDYIVIGKLDNAIYGVAKISEDGAILFGNVDSYKMMREWAEHSGADVDYLIRRGILEEFRHLAIGSERASVEEEVNIRIGLIGLYSRLAEETSDKRVRSRYMEIAHNLEKDLSTVKERYSKAYANNLQSLVELYCTDISELEGILGAEASGKGLSGAAVKEYVASRLGEIAEEVGDYEAVQNGVDAEEEPNGAEAKEEGDEVDADAAEDGDDGGPDGGDSG